MYKLIASNVWIQFQLGERKRISLFLEYDSAVQIARGTDIIDLLCKVQDILVQMVKGFDVRSAALLSPLWFTGVCRVSCSRPLLPFAPHFRGSAWD